MQTVQDTCDKVVVGLRRSTQHCSRAVGVHSEQNDLVSKISHENGKQTYITDSCHFLHSLTLSLIIKAIEQLEECFLWPTDCFCDAVFNFTTAIGPYSTSKNAANPCSSPLFSAGIQFFIKITTSGRIAGDKMVIFTLEVIRRDCSVSGPKITVEVCELRTQGIVKIG